MKIKKHISKLGILLLITFCSTTVFAQITSEEDMAKAVFETIQNNDLETFTSYCASEERFTKAVNGIEENSPKEIGLKQELKSENADNFTDENINTFNLFHKELTDNNIDITKSELSETITKEIRVEVPNLKATEIQFEIAFTNITYVINANVFITEGDIFIYEFAFAKKTIRMKGELKF